MTDRLLGNLNRGIVYVISAPAGTGKTTLVKKLTTEFPSVMNSVSFTTRSPRDCEVQGIDYHFVTREMFEQKIQDDDFLEYVTLYDQYYGTSKSWVEEQLKEGKHVVLVIDTQGALLLKNKIDAVYIFIAPPSMEELERRLVSRKTDHHQMIEKRLQWAQKELEMTSLYDYVIVNENLETAYETLRSILIAEGHRTKRMIN